MEKCAADSELTPPHSPPAIIYPPQRDSFIVLLSDEMNNRSNNDFNGFGWWLICQVVIGRST